MERIGIYKSGKEDYSGPLVIAVGFIDERPNLLPAETGRTPRSEERRVGKECA